MNKKRSVVEIGIMENEIKRSSKTILRWSMICADQIFRNVSMYIIVGGVFLIRERNRDPRMDHLTYDRL